MNDMDLVTKIIPGLMLAALIGWNMYKIQRNIRAMKKQHCSGSCQGCTHKNSCTSQKKNQK